MCAMRRLSQTGKAPADCIMYRSTYMSLLCSANACPCPILINKKRLMIRRLF